VIIPSRAKTCFLGELKYSGAVSASAVQAADAKNMLARVTVMDTR